MNELQLIEFNELKKSVAAQHLVISSMSGKTDEIYYALIGNKLSSDGGLVKQIHDMKDRQEKFETDVKKRIEVVVSEFEMRIEKLETAFSRLKGFALGIFVCGGLIGYLINFIIQRFLAK